MCWFGSAPSHSALQTSRWVGARRWVSILTSDSLVTATSLQIRDVQEWNRERKEGVQHRDPEIKNVLLSMMALCWGSIWDWRLKGTVNQFTPFLSPNNAVTILQKTAGWLSTIGYNWKESGSEPRNIYVKRKKTQ